MPVRTFSTSSRRGFGARRLPPSAPAPTPAALTPALAAPGDTLISPLWNADEPCGSFADRCRANCSPLRVAWSYMMQTAGFVVYLRASRRLRLQSPRPQPHGVSCAELVPVGWTAPGRGRSAMHLDSM